MIKTILIPTDFRIESLNTLKYALQNSTRAEIEVILLHSEILSDSITDLLFYSPESIIKSLVTPAFEEALSLIKNRFKEIRSLHIEISHAVNTTAISRFLTANKVDEIFIPKSYKLHLTKKSINTLPLLRHSMFPVREIDWESWPGTTEKDEIENLFN